MPAAASYGSLPFQEQIRFFRRKLNVNTQAWTDVLGAEHDVSFMVAGANRDDMVADFREAVRKAIEEGGTLEDFRHDFDRIVEQYGWDYTGGRNWRSRVIYETNLRQSYNAGRWAQLQSAKRVLPYWRYRHSDAVQHPRPIHESWDGLVLSADDPWWHTHYPANGWGCQCYVQGISERALRKLGKTGPDPAPEVVWQEVTIGQRSPGGPRTVRVPEGIDPGFGYAPGRSLDGAPPRAGVHTPAPLRGVIDRAAQSALHKTLRLPAAVAADSAAQYLALPRVLQALDAGYAAWQGALLADGVDASTYVVGALSPAAVRALADAGARPASAAIVAGDAEILAATSQALAAALTAEELSRLPALLRAPIAVLLDKAGATLHFIVFSDRGGDAVVDIMVRSPGAVGNTFDRATATSRAALQRQLRDGGLTLLQGTL